MQPCLDEATILAFGRGDVDPSTKRAVNEHVAECDECRSLVAQVVRSSSIVPKAELVDPFDHALPPAATAAVPAAAVPVAAWDATASGGTPGPETAAALEA